MVLDALANFVRGTAAESIDNSQTTIAVDDASIFPDPSVQGEFNVVIWDAPNFPRPDQDPDVEIVRVTATDTETNTLTVARAQETTSAATHPVDSAIHLSPTAKMFSDIEAEYTAQGENFNGEGTSEFSNLLSVSTGVADIDELGVLNLSTAPGVSNDLVVSEPRQNETERSLLVTVFYQVDPAGSDGESHRVLLSVDDAENNLGEAETAWDRRTGAVDSGERWDSQLSCIVPPGYYYQVDLFGDATSDNISEVFERPFTP